MYDSLLYYQALKALTHQQMSEQTTKALAIIPARGGSKRLPGKNIKPILGKPLICYTIEAAIKSNCFTKIILSSDNEEILQVGRQYQEVDPEVRPDRLAGDQVKVLELVCEIADRADLKKNYDVIALLLPTAPFRQAKHIQAGFAALTPDIDSVVSLTTYEFPPQLSVTLEENQFIQPVFKPCPLITGNTRSQDQKFIYRPNGGFYISWWKSFLVNQNFWKGKVKGYPMPRLASVDIDDQTDLDYAEFLLKQGAYQLDD